MLDEILRYRFPAVHCQTDFMLYFETSRTEVRRVQKMSSVVHSTALAVLVTEDGDTTLVVHS